MTGMRKWRVAPGSRVAASPNVSPEQWPHSGRGSGTTGGLAHRMEPRSGGSMTQRHKKARRRVGLAAVRSRDSMMLFYCFREWLCGFAK